jgi:hypothetical protein
MGFEKEITNETRNISRSDSVALLVVASFLRMLCVSAVLGITIGLFWETTTNEAMKKKQEEE